MTDSKEQDFSLIEASVIQAIKQLDEIEKLVKKGGKKNEQVHPWL